MSTIQPTLNPTSTRSTATVVTTAGALIALAIVVLLLTLAGGSRGRHAVISHPAPTYYSTHKTYGAVP